jgi:hypothetical protein
LNDGIVEIIAGLPVLSFGLGMIFDASLFFILTGLPVALFLPLKRAITIPRLGYVKFSPERQRKISKSLVLMFVAGSISLLLGIAVFVGFQGEVFNFRDFMMEYGLLVFGVVMASAFALVAIFFESTRFFGYGALVFGAWLVSYLLDIEPGVPVSIAGGVIALIGVGLLVRFLVQYPLPKE